MLQVLPGSDIPNTWSSFEKSFIPPALPSDCVFGENPARATEAETKPYHHPQPESAGHSSPAPNKADQFRMRSWMKPHEYRSRSVGGPSSRKPIVQRQPWRESSSYWRDPFVPVGQQPHRMHSFEFQHQSRPEGQCLPAGSGRTVSMSDIAGRRMTSEKCLGLTSQNLDTKTIKPEDLSPAAIHPIPRSNLHLANTITSFTDTDDGRDTAPDFDCSENSKDEKVLPGLDDHSFYQPPGLVKDSAEGLSPFQINGSPDTHSVSTNEGSFMSAAGSFSCPAYKVPNQWSIQQQEAWPGEFTWASMPCFPPGTQTSSFANTDFDSSMSMNDDISGLPALNNELQSTESTLVPSACQSDFNFTFGKDPASVNPPCGLFGSSSVDTLDNENAYRLDPPMCGAVTWPSARVDGIDSRHERRAFRTIPCHGETRNAFLIECKRRGLSYKDIKRIGGFKEAESTLRGRFRTLTKSKDQRVRKPQWQPRDVSSCFLDARVLS